MSRREEIAEAIIKFAQENNLEIHPGQEPLKWADLVIKKGGCPCVPGRDHCPCEFALDDIKQINRCRCGIFVNGAYIKEYNRLMGERRSRKRWKKEQEKDSSPSSVIKVSSLRNQAPLLSSHPKVGWSRHRLPFLKN